MLHGLLDPGFLGWVIGSASPMDFLFVSHFLVGGKSTRLEYNSLIWML